MSTRSRKRQYTLSVKVSPREKSTFAQHARDLGCTQSELVARAIRSVVAAPATPLFENARLHLVAVHAILVNGKADPDLIADLVATTRELIATIRRRADRP